MRLKLYHKNWLHQFLQLKITPIQYKRMGVIFTLSKKERIRNAHKIEGLMTGIGTSLEPKRSREIKMTNKSPFTNLTPSKAVFLRGSLLFK